MAAFPSLRITSAGSEEEEENCSAVDQQICNICLTQFARYTCPRCNIRYCSLLCYKSEKHAQCSESFYRDCFMTELQQRRGSSKEKHQMLEILKRLEEGGGDEVEGRGGTRSLEERLAGLDLEDTEVVWQQLTLSEKKEFQELVKSGRMGHLLSVYTPWWEVARPVVPLENPASDQSDYSIPEVLSNLPPMNSLIKDGTVSPHIHYSILNILYAYAYTVRLFNGGHHELPLQATQKRDLFNSAGFSTSVLTDVCHLLCSPKSHDSHVTRTLSDLHRLFGTARTQLKAAEKGAASLGAGSRQLWLARKKLLFLTSWANENLDLLTPLTKIVELEYEMSRRDIVEQCKAESEVKRRRKEDDMKTNAEHKLIEELS